MEVYVLLMFFLQTHRRIYWTHNHVQYVIIRRSGQVVAFRVCKSKFENFQPQKGKN